MTKSSLFLVAPLSLLAACSSDENQSCYSPSANLSSAYENGAKGCACKTGVDQGVCVKGVALICESDQWQAVMDGPCMIKPVFDARPQTTDGEVDRPVADLGLPDGPEAGAGRDGQPEDAMCIRLGDFPSVMIVSEDNPPRRLTLSLVSGPCTVHEDRVDFRYWEKGYSCPKLSDSVICEVKVSSDGESMVVPVTFSVGGYPTTWHPMLPYGSSAIVVRFSAGDAGIDGASHGG